MMKYYTLDKLNISTNSCGIMLLLKNIYHTKERERALCERSILFRYNRIIVKIIFFLFWRK